MRKLWTVILMFFCVTCLTGCMRFNTTVKVKSNGKADITMRYAVSTEFSEEDLSGYMSMPEEEMKKMQEEGWECSEYSEDSYMGYEFVKRDVSFEELAGSFNDAGDGTTINADDFTITKNGFNYTIDWKVFEDDDISDISSYKSYFDMAGGYMNFVLELPVKPLNSNATTISENGKTLTWDLLALEQGQTIHVEFNLINIKVIIGCIAAGSAILLIIVILIIVMISKNKKKAYMPMQQAQGVVPGSTPQPGMQNGVAGFAAQPGVQNSIAGSASQEKSFVERSNDNAQSSDPVDQPFNKSVADEIVKLKNLMDSGVISPEEFEVQKKKLLDQ